MTVLVDTPVASTGRSPVRIVLQELRRRPTTIIAITYLAVLVVASVSAPLIAPYSPAAQDLLHTLAGRALTICLGRMI